MESDTKTGSIRGEGHGLSEEDKKFVELFSSSFVNNFPENRILEILETVDDSKRIGFIKFSINNEIVKNDLSFLREESMGISLAKVYWFKFSGFQYLEHIIHPLFKDIKKLKLKKPINIDPQVVGDSIAKKGVNIVKKLIKPWFAFFLDSCKYFPTEFGSIIRYTFQSLKKWESNKSKKELLSYELVSTESMMNLFGGFFLLRFICPAINSPVIYGLCGESEMTPEKRSVLVIISKVLYSLPLHSIKKPGIAAEQFKKIIFKNSPKFLDYMSELLQNKKKERKKNANALSLQKDDCTIPFNDYKEIKKLQRTKSLKSMGVRTSSKLEEIGMF
jgi:hypothetical protein